MLAEMRRVVDKMWEAAEKLDNFEFTKNIPVIPHGSDLRHAMKGDILYFMLNVDGLEQEISEEKIEYLRYVLHIPINKQNRDGYIERAREVLQESRSKHIRLSRRTRCSW